MNIVVQANPALLFDQLEQGKVYTEADMTGAYFMLIDPLNKGQPKGVLNLRDGMSYHVLPSGGWVINGRYREVQVTLTVEQ